MYIFLWTILLIMHSCTCQSCHNLLPYVEPPALGGVTDDSGDPTLQQHWLDDDSQEPRKHDAHLEYIRPHHCLQTALPGRECKPLRWTWRHPRDLHLWLRSGEKGESSLDQTALCTIKHTCYTIHFTNKAVSLTHLRIELLYWHWWFYKEPLISMEHSNSTKGSLKC